MWVQAETEREEAGVEATVEVGVEVGVVTRVQALDEAGGMWQGRVWRLGRVGSQGPVARRGRVLAPGGPALRGPLFPTGRALDPGWLRGALPMTRTSLLRRQRLCQTRRSTK